MIDGLMTLLYCMIDQQINCMSWLPDQTFADWLANKRRQGNTLRTRSCDEQDDTNITMSLNQTAATDRLFLHRFLQRRRQELLQSVANSNNDDVTRLLDSQKNTKVKRTPVKVSQEDMTLKSAGNSRVGIFDIGCHGYSSRGDAVRPPNTTIYGEWKTNKKLFDSKRDSHSATEIRHRHQLESVRRKLLLEGITYEEWLGYKNMEKHIMSRQLD